jgi:hypothetical protein
LAPNAKKVAYVQGGPSRNKKGNAAASLCLLNYIAFLRPAADRVVSKLPWVMRFVARVYGFEIK